MPPHARDNSQPPVSGAAKSASETAAVIASAQRESARGTLRDAPRTRIRSQSERYGVPREQMARNTAYEWVALKIRGAPNPRLSEFRAGGWTPARAIDFPEHSGYIPEGKGTSADDAWGRAGITSDVTADSPVIINDLMLVQRPLEYDREARREEANAARQQVDDQMTRIRQQSQRAIGDKTVLSRTRTVGPAPADMVPDDADVEMS